MKRYIAFLMTCLACSLAAFAEIEVQDDPEPGQGDNRPGIAVPQPRDLSVTQTVKSEPMPSSGSDTLLFVNGDKLHGTLFGIDQDGSRLKWKHVNVEKPIEFGMESIAEMQFETRKTALGGGTALIELSNDDMLAGTPVSLDDDKLVLDTRYAGRMTIRRAMMRRIVGGVKPVTALYEGPVDIADWTVGRGGNNTLAWRFKEGALYGFKESPIARSVENMKNRVEFEFNATWRGGHPAFFFSFFNDNLMRQANCYSLQVSASSVYLYRYDKNTGQQHLGSVEVARLASGQTDHARFNVLVDKEKKSVTLLLDGQMVKQWTDSIWPVGSGKVIMFQPQNQAGVKIDGIKVSDWDGKMRQIVDGAVVEEKEDVIRLVNGDKVSGKLKSIGGGNIKVETSYATMDIPFERVAEIAMSATSMERARREKKDVKALFAGGGAVTLQLRKIDGGVMTGASESFGEVSIPVDVFRAVEFNIYREKVNKEDDSFKAF